MNDNEEATHIYGSALNPGTIGAGGKEKKELAKPNAKVEVKTFNRDAKGGATEESLRKREEDKKQTNKKSDIWSEEEVNIQ